MKLPGRLRFVASQAPTHGALRVPHPDSIMKRRTILLAALAPVVIEIE
ncbi:hypothetical protein ACVWWQ_000977 [Rhodanobacter sp. TND4EL1]